MREREEIERSVEWLASLAGIPLSDEGRYLASALRRAKLSMAPLLAVDLSEVEPASRFSPPAAR